MSEDKSVTAVTEAGEQSFQDRVQPWMLACFGAEIAGDREERNHRFLEEALELVQSCGASRSEAHQLVDYTFDRPADPPQREVGGVMVTLAALCLAQGFDMHECAEAELARVWTKIEVIRAKQAAKPKHSPLPEYPATTSPTATSGAREAANAAATEICDWCGVDSNDGERVAAIILKHFPSAPVSAADGADQCAWTLDDSNDGDFWETGCGEAFRFTDGGPTDNGFIFCYKCGKRIDAGKYSDSDSVGEEAR